MNSLNLNNVKDYVNKNIIDFHQRRINSLNQLKIAKLLNKNPYLFKAKNITTAGNLIEGLLEAHLSSSEEKLFGDFLEGLAIFVANETCNGRKSAATGVDLEFINDGIHYVVSVKSGWNWGNSSQQDKLQQDLQKAVATIKQARYTANVQAVLGICYGKTKTNYLRGYLKVVGQNFWYLISENRDLYTDIIEPIGHRAKYHNDCFIDEKSKVINRLTREFIRDFCDESGAIDWVKLVEWNSGNFDFDRFISK